MQSLSPTHYQKKCALRDVQMNRKERKSSMNDTYMLYNKGNTGGHMDLHKGIGKKFPPVIVAPSPLFILCDDFRGGPTAVVLPQCL
jgi:hypothetical protein